ncbi:DUF6895 family protein [Fulvimonas soli]|jgi:hypothetical protein|uniref:DUF6895 domain-containing protein n=1 Tax=Fulvimonas soli TaxID=155197 RepID=A0A316IIE8_9GAMM|nr:hypothetical protein [Fulvimonas soli]PWK92863.1 hypothetical protein C7456_101201 [Fulvimonas soli]TNY26495.1 hypothetical protein BV497_08420 [Fulvimonas soli]
MERVAAPPSRWSAADLARRLCRVLDIAAHAVERLAPAGYADAEQPANSLRPEKVVAETALLLLAAAAAAPAHPGVRAGIARAARRLLPHARGERVLRGLCLEPALALDYAHAHVCLERIGYPDPAFDALLDLSAQAAAGRERPPHRMLEQLWSADLHAGACSRRRGAALARLSQLNLPMDLLGGSREDAYAFTHALMYCARFGRPPLRLPRPRRAVLAEAEGALAHCLDAQDYDLAGELLLAWPLTGAAWSPAAAFAFRVLARVVDEAGFLPAPGTRLDRLELLQGDARKLYLLATSYHTIYVMGLLCAAALLPGRAPPASPPAAKPATGVAARLLAGCGDEAPPPHWREDFDRLAAPERDALAGLLLDVALHRRARRRDFAGLRALLGTAWELGLADRPVAGQAAELLQRAAVLQRLLPADRSPAVPAAG